VAPYDEYYNQFHFLEIQAIIWKHCIPRSINPLKELKSLLSLTTLLFKIRPTYIFSFTIKANLYCGLINFLLHSNHFPTITGIGRYFIKPLYALCLKKCKKVIFQNYCDAALFKREKITSEKKTIIVPGSGVNPEMFKPIQKNTFPKTFLFVSRLPYEKGLNYIGAACQLLKDSHPDWSLDFFGYPSTNYATLPDNMHYKGFYQPMVQIYQHYSCFLYCSDYREGLPKVTLEALASGTPLLIAGFSLDSRIIKPGYNGFKKNSLNPRDIHLLMTKWIECPESKKLLMRTNARKLVLKKFSEIKVAQQYLNII
jgi:galacturonosyltransferase